MSISGNNLFVSLALILGGFLAGFITAAGAAESDQPPGVYATQCATCHGDTGKGDGPTASVLDPKPADLTSREVQDLSDDRLRKVIVGGGAAVDKSPIMPAFGHLEDEQVTELITFIRSLTAE